MDVITILVILLHLAGTMATASTHNSSNEADTEILINNLTCHSDQECTLFIDSEIVPYCCKNGMCRFTNQDCSMDVINVLLIVSGTICTLLFILTPWIIWTFIKRVLMLYVTTSTHESSGTDQSVLKTYYPQISTFCYPRNTSGTLSPYYGNTSKYGLKRKCISRTPRTPLASSSNQLRKVFTNNYMKEKDEETASYLRERSKSFDLPKIRHKSLISHDEGLVDSTTTDLRIKDFLDPVPRKTNKIMIIEHNTTENAYCPPVKATQNAGITEEEDIDKLELELSSEKERAKDKDFTKIEKSSTFEDVIASSNTKDIRARHVKTRSCERVIKSYDVWDDTVMKEVNANHSFGSN